MAAAGGSPAAHASTRLIHPWKARRRISHPTIPLHSFTVGSIPCRSKVRYVYGRIEFVEAQI
ncbi:hypothetical protein C2845_PM12G03740 [Panicum miliaceum]|uniref:Uncharacterized protein n=1 Tax=Panicum miliaceum TaxID=4540 RepID=A0A3L6QFM9_PANMI|nr:hypothetical protein C2845_PM12G03740 [Panicum miliaceum]